MCSHPHPRTNMYSTISFHHSNPKLTPLLFHLFHARHIYELPKIYLQSIFSPALNLDLPSASGTLSLVDLLWSVLSDPMLTADAETFLLFVPIGCYLFPRSSLWDVLMCNSPLLTNRCHSRMNCRGIESRDWQDSGGGSVGVWGIDCVEVYTSWGHMCL